MTSPSSTGSSTVIRSAPRARSRQSVSERRSQAARAASVDFGRDVANLPAALLDLRRGRVERVREQQVLVVRVRDARERAHLRVRQPPVRERRRDRRQRRAARAPCAPSRAPPTATCRSATRATRRSCASPTSRTRSDRRSRARAAASDRSRRSSGARGGRSRDRGRRSSGRSLDQMRQPAANNERSFETPEVVKKVYWYYIQS